MAPTSPPRYRRAPAARRASSGVASNERLTATNAAVLLVLLAVEGFTILSIGPLLKPHVFIGMLLVPPVALKIGSTGYRFVRYYLGAPPYREKGPPHPLLRLLGPLVVVLTLAVLSTGIALLFVGAGARSSVLFLHKASFVLWFGVMALHVLGHVLETARIAPLDLYGRTRRQVSGAGLRQWSIAVSLALGVLLGLLMLPKVGPYAATFFGH